jgi:enediyne biosynthesis protein E4
LLDDIIIGGSVGLSTKIFTQNKSGKFSFSLQQNFEKDKLHEDGAITFIDYDLDGDKDLLIASGGNEYSKDPSKYFLRLYKNTNGIFEKINHQNTISIMSNTMAVADYNQDGIQDIFIGSRGKPGHYGREMKSYIFNISTTGVINAIDSFSAWGMVTSAAFGDMNLDQKTDLVVGGEWQPMRVLYNENNKFVERKNSTLLKSNGWWRSVVLNDIDNDGDMDIIAGNHGMNSRYKATETNPFYMMVNDFDNNGSTDAVINYFNKDNLYPIAIRDNMLDQMPYLKKKYNRYEKYSKASIPDIFSSEQISNSNILEINEMRSCIFINNNSTFSKQVLPSEAQISPVNSIIIEDFNKDGLKDMLIAGNDYATEVESGQNDAGIGLYMTQNIDHTFDTKTFKQNGVNIDGDVKNISYIKIKNSKHIIVLKNQDYLQVYKLKKIDGK